jgi:hypothetical protein
MIKKSQDTEEKRKYLLEIDEDQAQALSQACEFMSRIAMGQFSEITSGLWFKWKVNDPDTLDVCEKIVTTAKSMLTDLPRNSYFGIMSADVQENCKVMYDLHQVIRYRLAWDRRPDTKDWDIHKDEPMRVSSSPLPSIKISS